jgi:hypothetical protein
MFNLMEEQIFVGKPFLRKFVKLDSSFIDLYELNIKSFGQF